MFPFLYSHSRPVVAVLEVGMYRVDERKRSCVREEVGLALGPSDPTISIQERDDEITIEVPQLLDSLKPFGEVVLVRWVGLELINS